MRPREIRLLPGETRALLQDFGACLPTIPAGTYAAWVGLHKLFGKEIANSNDATIEVASLTEQVWRAVHSAVPELKRDIPTATPWGWLAMEIEWRQLPNAVPKEVFSQLASYCFLGDAAHEGEIENAHAELLERVPNHLRDFAASPRYEGLLAKGQEEAAKKPKGAVL